MSQILLYIERLTFSIRTSKLLLTLCISAKPSSICAANTFKFCTVKVDSVE